VLQCHRSSQHRTRSQQITLPLHPKSGQTVLDFALVLVVASEVLDQMFQPLLKFKLTNARFISYFEIARSISRFQFTALLIDPTAVLEFIPSKDVHGVKSLPILF
jgi:hypothetical protein